MGEADQDLLRRAVPTLGEVGFGERFAEQDDFIADPIVGPEFDEGGLHADFEDAAGGAIHETRAETEAVGVTAADDTVMGRDKTSVTCGAVGFAGFDQSGTDARGPLVEGEAGSHGVEPGGGIIQQRRTGGMAIGIGDSVRAVIKSFYLIGVGGVGEDFVEVEPPRDVCDLIARAAKSLLPAIHGKGGFGGLQKSRALHRPNDGVNVGCDVVGGVVRAGHQRDRPLARPSIQLVFDGFGSIENVVGFHQVANRDGDLPGPKSVRIGLHDRDHRDGNSARDRLGVASDLRQIDLDGDVAIGGAVGGHWGY